jgi:hypothetical protein
MEEEENEVEDAMYSDSSVDVDSDQLPPEAFADDLSSDERLANRFRRHLLKLTFFKIAADDPLLVALISDSRSSMIQDGLSFSEQVSTLADELNSVIGARGNKNVNTSTRSNCFVRKSILTAKRFWKIPPLLLEELLKKHPGRDSAEINRMRVDRITHDIEELVRIRAAARRLEDM